MADEQQNMGSFATKAAALKKQMQPLEHPWLEENIDSTWDNPYFERTKADARAMHNRGEVTDQDANDWLVVNKMKDDGVWNLSKEDAQYAHSRKLITDEQANAFMDYRRMEYDGNMQAGKYLLDRLSAGGDKEAVLSEMEGLSIPMYGPEDLVADIITGGTISLMRTSIKTIAKQGAKQTIKKTAQMAALDASFGAVAGGTMTGVGFVTDSGTVQLLSGLISPLGASVMLGLGRNGLKQFLMNVKLKNKKLADEMLDAVKGAETDDEFAKIIRQELGEAELEAVKPELVPYKPKTKQIEVREQTDTPRNLEHLDVATGDEAIKSVSIMEAMRTGETAIEGVKPSKLVENIEKRGTVKAVDLIDEVRKTFADEIDTSRRGGRKGKGTTVTHKAQEAEAEIELKKMAQWSGQRVKDMKEVIGWGENLQAAVTTARRQTRAFNKVFGQYTDEINGLIQKTVTFADELKALEHIRLFGKMTRVVYGVRSEWGRGLESYKMPWMKSGFDFDALPADSMKLLEKSERKRVQQILSAFKSAKNPRMKALRARNVNRGRFLLGMLEFEQAMLLSHPLTQAVNIAGNTGTLMWRNAAAYAATNVDAWKIAGGWRRPLSRDEMAMRAAHYQLTSFGDAMVQSFYLPKDQMVDAFKQSRAQKAHMGKQLTDTIMGLDDVGTVWKAAWSGEAQLDNFAKYAEESRGALPDDINSIMIPFGKGKTIGETQIKLPRAMNMPIGNLIRLGFHGLTAGDELFKTINYRQALSELAYREVMKNGGTVVSDTGTTTLFKLSPETIDQAVALQLKNPTDEMLTEAMKVQRRETFTNQLDQVTGGIESVLNAPGIGPMLRMAFLPFYKIAVNLPKYALQQTPLGATAKWQKEAIAAGGKAKYEIYARWTMGTTIMLASGYLYSQGKLTGHIPADRRGSAEVAGVQEYSYITDDGEMIDISKIEPLAYLAGMSADLTKAGSDTLTYILDPVLREEAELELNHVMMGWLNAFIKPVMEKSVMKGVKEAVDVFIAPDRMNWDKLAVRQMEKYMPRLLNFATEMSGHQEEMREARSMMEAWNRKWGTLAAENERAHPKRHLVYGTPVKRTERAFALLNQKKLSDDPVLQEMWRVAANPEKISPKFTIDGIEIDITDDYDAYDRIQDIIAESNLKRDLTDWIASDTYQNITDVKLQRTSIMEIIRDYRVHARETAFMDSPLFGDEREKFEKDFEREIQIGIGKKYRKDPKSLHDYWTNKFFNIKENK